MILFESILGRKAKVAPHRAFGAFSHRVLLMGHNFETLPAVREAATPARRNQV